MRRKTKRVLSFAMGVLLFVSMLFVAPKQTAEAAENRTDGSFREKIEFEDANRFEENGMNYIDSSLFSGYSGSGYLYLVSGWGEVHFSVPQDGEYKITLAANADTYKENWLYLDENGAGALYTAGNKWEEYTIICNLSAGSHKFGVSANWGYTALDYVIIEAVNAGGSTPTPTPEVTATPVPTVKPTPEPTAVPTPTPTSPAVEDGFSVKVEFEDAKCYEENGRNRIASDLFSGYSGSGYLYLEAGWGEVSFTVPKDGEYRITLVTNADSYKENWLYLDEAGAGTLYTGGNSWEKYTEEYTLGAGTHKFGVSANWGYTALDYVVVEAVDTGSTETPQPTVQPTEAPKPTTEPTATPEPTVTPTPTATPEPTEVPGGGESQGNGMYVKEGRLYDGNGNEFIMRGINVAHAWYTGYTETSIEAVADLGANCVRVVLADGTQWTKTGVSEVENIISWCEKNGLVCILEVHDHTGYDDTARLNTAVDYWLSMKDLLNAHKDYVIVNVANEWLGTWGNGSTWTGAYQSAIRTMRNAGIENVIMVDAAGYGQETATCIDNCRSVYAADETGNTMFSIHMYSVTGADADTVKSNIDAMLSKGVSFCIGEFGDFQNGGDVDEQTIMQYCTEKGIGYAAWSWKGNGGTDITLDLSRDWAGTDLTDWGKYVFYAEGIGIQATARMAYTLKTYDGPGHEGEVTPPEQPGGSGEVDAPSTEIDTELSAGWFEELDGWYVSGEGDDTESEITVPETLSNGGIRLNFDLREEKYPYLCNMVGGLDLSENTSIDLVVRNNNLYPLQIQPIFKVGGLWEWTEYDKYQEVPAQTTTILSFDLTGCPNLDEVMAVLFRVQGSGSAFAGTIDFLSVVTDYDFEKDSFGGAVAELNRPKTAAFFTWQYPESSWTNTTEYSCDENGTLTVGFADITEEDAAGPQTETRPGTGTGLNCSAYGKLVSTITNNSDEDIHITLVMKTTGDWIWQENAGTVDGVGGERVIAPGETVEVVYELDGAEWKSQASGWSYTGKLQGAEDVRAIAYKIYAGQGEKVTGTVVISDFEFQF